ncbi:MAG: hypothetical protein JOZ14_07915 [Acidobacteria bacterium]|nr:hypothetical protein [Acidobacteriota bacterium]
MTSDERLDRLTERHEALTESLELLTRDVRELLEIAQNRERRLTRLKGDEGD